MNQNTKSWLILIFCNFIWAFHFTCIKLTQGQVGPYFTVWAPMLISVLLLIPFVIKKIRKRGGSIKDVLVFVQLAALGAFPAQVLMTWGTQYSLASNATILVLILPIITTVFAFLILGEKMNKIKWLSFLIAIAGVILCSFEDIKTADFGSSYAVGNLLIFIALVGNAYYNVGCKKISGQYSEIEMVFYTYLVMVIMLTPLVLYFEGDIFSRIPDFTTNTWIGMIALTIFHNFLSMVLFFKAMKYLQATQIAVSNYLITFMGLPIAAILLGEKLSGQVVLGGLLVLTSTLILSIVDRPKQKKEKAIRSSELINE